MSDRPDVTSRQRAALCDLLDSLTDEQWDAETLCDGWDTGDVVAHLLVREREPIAALGILLKPVASYTDSRMRARKASGRAAMTAALRSGPPVWMRLPVVGDVQVGEDWVHAADIARGGAADVPGADLPIFDGTEDPEVARLLWKAVGRFAPLSLRDVDGEGAVGFTDGDRIRTYQVGGAVARPASGATPDVTVTGAVGDLLLFVTGRRRARVEVSGDPVLTRQLQSANRTV